MFTEGVGSMSDEGEYSTEKRRQQSRMFDSIHRMLNILDNAQAFLERLKYDELILAKGGRGKSSRPVIVDWYGEKWAIEQIVNRSESKTFDKMMKSVDLGTLPTVETAQAQQAEKKELRDLLQKLSDRQATEAKELADTQKRQIHGDKERHQQERQDQQKQFVEERNRYISEYQESRHIHEEIHEREKQQSLEPGEDPKKGFSR
jgi:hypothetical protein